MNKFIWLTPVYWDGKSYVEINYKVALNVSHIKQFAQTEHGFSLVTQTDAPLGSDTFHKFKESAGEIMSQIMGD